MPAAVVAALGGVGATIAAGTAVVGVGLSAASAAGAFSSPVDKWKPTPQEMEAVKWSNKTYDLGRQIQAPLDAMSRDDLTTMSTPGYYDRQAGAASNQYANQMYPAVNNLVSNATASGGPGSGRFFDATGKGAALINGAMREGNVQGRIGGLTQSMSRTGQFLGRRTADLKSGLNGMTSGGAQAAEAQASRIQSQVQNNIASNQAMGQLGGTIASVGMAGYKAA